MATPARGPRTTLAEYLRFENASATKHAFVDGQVFSMPGGTAEHGALAMAMALLIGERLRGKPCRAFSSDVRVGVRAADLVAYPALTVVCGQLERDAEDPESIANPFVIVEVLSDSTEIYARGDKAFRYRQCPSLREYIMVSQKDKRVEVQHREANSTWVIETIEGAGQFEIRSLGFPLNLDDIYRNDLPG